MPLAEPPHSLAGSRFADVVAGHWPVFAVLAAVLLAVGVVGLLLRRRTGGALTAGSTQSTTGGTAQIVGWATVLVLPPVIYVSMLAAGFSVQSSIFAAMLGATVLFWVFGLVEEFVPALVAVVATLIIGLAPPDVALAGFASPNLLLLVGVYALSAVISSSGLSYRLMLRLLLRLPDKPVWHQVTLLGSGYLAEWAESQGIARVTAYRWFREGKLLVPARKVGGLILVDCPAAPSEPATSETVVYARVSSADQKSDLDRQVARVTVWATGQGMAVDRVVTEVGSALNGRCKKFLALLGDPAVSTIVVEHRDRFARLAVEYIEAALSAQGRRLVVVDDAEVDDDLVRDMTEILTSFCARLYGRRAAANRAQRMIAAAQSP